MRILIKADDIFTELNEIDLINFFQKNSDEDGNVEKEIVVFTDAIFKMDNDTIRWTLSDYSVDRDMERIDPAGWDLKAYRANPIILWAHDYMKPAIGKMSSVKVRDGKLTGNAQFSGKEVDEFGWMVGQKVKEGILTNGSVGFKSQKVEIITSEDKKEPARLIHRKQELYEFSIVNIAANPNARVERGIKVFDERGMKVFDDSQMEVNDILHVQESIQQIEAEKSEDNYEHETMECEIAGLAKRIADLEKAATNSKSYIGSLMNVDRETNDPESQEPSEMAKLFTKPETKSMEDLFHGRNQD